MTDPMIKEMLSDDFLNAVEELLYSIDEEEMQLREGSMPGRTPNINQNRTGEAQRLYQDYFFPSPVYNEVLVRRLFRLSRNILTGTIKFCNATIISHNRETVQELFD